MALEKKIDSMRISSIGASITAALIAAIVYMLTMQRSIGYLDSGEVAAAASTLGIMHPTGYPTLTMLGYIVAAIAPMRDILALNALAALLAAIGVGAMSLLFNRLLVAIAKSRNRDAQSNDSRAKSKLRGRTKSDDCYASDTGDEDDRGFAVIGAIAALFVGFTAIWWEQATGFEVYALQALLLPLVTLLFMRFVDREREFLPSKRASRTSRKSSRASVTTSKSSGNASRGFTREGIAFAFVLGVAFTNHMMTVFLAPAFLVYYFWSLRFNARSLRRIAFLIPPFIAGLLPYIYLPLRSSMHPRFNWGRPETWERFTTHVSGKFAWEWMFSSSEVYAAQTSYFLGRLPSELAYVGVPIAMWGLVVLFRRSPRIAVWSLLMFVACAAYAGGYRIYDIELYYATAVLAIGVWIAAAIWWLLRINRFAAMITGCALVAASLALHYESVDSSGNALAEDVVFNTLTNAPPNAMIFSSNAATFVTGSYYLQAVELIRPDVTVINHDYLSLSWYLDELTDWRPDLMAAVASEVASYREELVKAERKEPFDGFRLNNDYDRMVQSMVEWQLKRGAVVVVGEMETAFGSKYQIVPWHFGYRLVNDTGYVAMAFPNYRFRHWRHFDPFTASIYETYGRRLSYRASYESEHGNDSLARRYREYALTFDPQIDLDDVDDLPLDAMTQVQATAEFYQRLRASMIAR